MSGGESPIGRTALVRRTFTAEDVRAFSVLTGDLNPLHVPPEGAKRPRRPLVQGAFLSALGPTLVGTELPGPGTVYMSQTFKYHLPVYAGDTVEVRGEIVGYEPVEHHYTVLITCRNDMDELVMDGTMIVQRTPRD